MNKSFFKAIRRSKESNLESRITCMTKEMISGGQRKGPPINGGP